MGICAPGFHPTATGVIYPILDPLKQEVSFQFHLPYKKRPVVWQMRGEITIPLPNLLDFFLLSKNMRLFLRTQPLDRRMQLHRLIAGLICCRHLWEDKVGKHTPDHYCVLFLPKFNVSVVWDKNYTEWLWSSMFTSEENEWEMLHYVMKHHSVDVTPAMFRARSMDTLFDLESLSIAPLLPKESFAHGVNRILDQNIKWITRHDLRHMHFAYHCAAEPRINGEQRTFENHKFCKDCRLVCYCSVDCQAKDWGLHQYHCQVLRRQFPRTWRSGIRLPTPIDVSCTVD